MVRRVNGRPTWLSILAIIATVAMAIPVVAQSTGMIKGVVTDEQRQPVENAKVTIEMSGGTGRRFELKTNKKGEYLQIGLPPGSYQVTAEKEKAGSQPLTVNVRVSSPVTVNLIMGMASAATQASAAQLKKEFDEGVALSSAGKHAEAVERFTAAATLNAACYDCYNNIGFSYTQLKDWEKAEAAYKKSTEVKPDDASGYSGLANVYNAQRKFDLAAVASAKATELAGNLSASGGAAGSADAQYNQGVILWNAGKIADAKKAFEGAVSANPNHAEAHYQLGMALVNEGNLAGAATEFETYVKLTPEGPNAATAKSLVAQLKK